MLLHINCDRNLKAYLKPKAYKQTSTSQVEITIRAKKVDKTIDPIKYREVS
jgi:hypothetical protein